jgi:uncharacterized membrane protein YdbT with pleckstrin-like domain
VPRFADYSKDSNQKIEEKMQEQTFFEIKPSYRAYLGWIIVSSLMILVGIGLVLLPIVLIAAWIAVNTTSYRLTNERLLIKSGLIAKTVQEIELYRVQDVTVSQGILQRLFGVGAVSVVSTDKSTPRLWIKGILAPEAIKEQIRTTYRDARKSEGVRASENIF